MTRINVARLMADIEAMAAIGALPEGGNRRIAMSPEDEEGRAYLITRMREAGLETRVDAAGSIFGRREADSPGVSGGSVGAGAVLIGSHIDTIERGGRFDGVLGVFGALESVRTLNEAGFKTRRPIEVVAFTDEEERFLGFLGSYAFAGDIDYDSIRDRTDADGFKLTDAMEHIRLDPRKIGQAKRDPATVSAFVELHIEQGPLLEQEGAAIGVVVQVKGNYRWGVTVEGQTDHAGSPLAGRKDAFMAMQAIVQAMINYRTGSGDADTTLTVGRVVIEPNIETAQPGRASFSVDVRSPSLAFLQGADRELGETIERVAASAGQTISREPILIEDPVEFDPEIREEIGRSATKRGYTWREIYSGAGHDAQVIGTHFPTAMIFVPSVDGRSHCPEEFTRTEDLEKGVNVLFDTTVALAARE